ncbi:hypothetical protein A2U01_0055921, partial [Trifolium medium]|nr:hypothetical protein [Trifolium medium]
IHRSRTLRRISLPFVAVVECTLLREELA